MPIQQIDPHHAHELMQAGHVYVDVRTVEEFASGRPEGALNVPAFIPNAWGQMAPNPAFLSVMSACFTPDTPLILGCRVGNRSQMACEMLAHAGFAQLSNMQGGFHGARHFGGAAVPGWVELGLPVVQGADGDTTYASLQARLSADPNR